MTSTTQSLLDLVASNPLLHIQLEGMRPTERVDSLCATAKKLGGVKGMVDGKLDDELIKYCDYIFRAIDEASGAGETARNSRVLIISDLFLWFTDTKHALTSGVLFPKIPKTFARLCQEVVSTWVTAETEDEAQRHMCSIADLYLKTGSEAECKEWRQAIRTAVNRSSSEVSVERLARALIALSGITTWNFSDSIFDSVAIGFVRKQILASPGAIVLAARMHLTLGAGLSEAAENAVMQYLEDPLKTIVRVDETARALVKHIGGRRWYVSDVDAASRMATITIMMNNTVGPPILDSIADQVEEAAKTWKNPYLGAIRVRYEVLVPDPEIRRVVRTGIVEGCAAIA
jgi:hypothetical protein